MNEIVTVANLPTAFNPHIPLVKRTEAWIVELYQKAQALVELEYADYTPEEAHWKVLTQEERQVDAVEDLDDEKRDWNIQYQNLVDEKALEVADGLTEAIRGAIANIITSRKRKRLRWQRLKGYDKIKKLAKETIVLPDGSSGRQISSLIENQMDDIEKSGVPEETTLALLARPDKFLINASRAISRTRRDEDLTDEEKLQRIGDIVEYSASAEKASHIRRDYINGQHMQIPRDVVKMGNETLVTFWCEDEQQFSTLDRKTETISVEWGQAQPILSETQAKRSRHQALFDLGVVIGILQAGDFTAEEIGEYFEIPPIDILTKLTECGIVGRVGDKYRL